MKNPWFELPDLVKANLICSAIDYLFFPYTAPWCGPDSPDEDVTYRTYLEMDSKQPFMNTHEALNDLSRFWGTDSVWGSNEVFTDRVKKIVNHICSQFFVNGEYEWINMPCIRFTAYKSHMVKYEVLSGVDGVFDEVVEFNLDERIFDGCWDRWCLGFIELMIRIISFAIEKSEKINE